MDKNAEIRKQIAELQAKMGDTVTVADFKGHPTLRFDGGGKPFAIGFAKARRILKHRVAIEKLIAE